ncbi:MAG: methyltransferase domain-containing protein [bacterium]
MLDSDSLILDAGAGDPKHHIRNPRLSYITFDLCIGQADWDYSAIDAVGALDALPFRDETFDGIICTQVLEHVREPEMVLRELFRVVKSGKKLYLTVPQEWYLHQVPNDYYRYTKFGLQYLFKKACFTVERIEPMGGYFLFMSHRVTLFPRFLFPPLKNPILRLLRKPFKELIVFIFTNLLPRLLVRMDRYDNARYVTAWYKAVGVK